MKRFKEFTLLTIIAIITATACVPGRQYEEVKAHRDQLLAEQESLRAKSKSVTESSKDMEVRIEALERQVRSLREDTAMLGTSNRKLRGQYDKILSLNDQLLAKSDQMRGGAEEEHRKLLVELDNVRTQLELKEDRLDKLDRDLKAKEASLAEREAKIKELTDMLEEKEAAMSSLKDRIASALAGYEDKGLSVEYKNGRVYVNMEAKLLFATGSTEVGKEGREAIKDLARVISEQEDLSILIEGHTDTDKLSSSRHPRDNWELSVLRATEVVKIMLENSSIQPERLIAAGRSEYIPIDPDDKARNRRIEVVLTPNLDAVMELLD